MNTEPAVTDRTAAYLETQLTVARLAAVMTAAAIKAAHAQWTILDVAEPLHGEPPIRVIDPEALLLISLWLMPRDPSLRRGVHAWIEAWSDLLSVQRTRNIAKSYGSDVHAELRAVAVTAHEKGKDFRWGPVIKGAGASVPTSMEGEDDAGASGAAASERASVSRLPVGRASLLVLRFRMAFGVGARADALAYLLARGSAWSTVTEISLATGYTPSAIRRALDRMAEAEIVLTVDDGTTRFRCEAAQWAALLGLHTDVAPWPYWLQQFTFVATLVEWAESVARRKLTAYAITEGLRGVARKFRPTDDRDELRAWDHAFRDGSTMEEMELALTAVASGLARV
jgi:DNA-binding transcriptional ArsR family regulator